MAEVIWAPSAVEDLQALFDFIARDSFRQAEHVVHCITRTTRQLGVLPRMGRRFALRPECRQVFWKTFRIVYRVEHNGRVRVLAIVHGARDWSVEHLTDQSSGEVDG